MSHIFKYNSYKSSIRFGLMHLLSFDILIYCFIIFDKRYTGSHKVKIRLSHILVSSFKKEK